MGEGPAGLLVSGGKFCNLQCQPGEKLLSVESAQKLSL